MKARVKATDRVIQVMNVIDNKGNSVWEEISDTTNHSPQYSCDDLEFLDIPEDIQKEKRVKPDYWEKLKHQYAGMAMQSYVNNNVYLSELQKMCKEPREMRDYIADLSIALATALVNKLKEESQCKEK